MYKYLPLFKKRGKNILFFPLNSSFSYKTIEIGDDVFIGPGARFSAIKEIKIGSKVMFGPSVTIMGGDHDFSQVGRYMFDVLVSKGGTTYPLASGNVMVINPVSSAP